MVEQTRAEWLFSAGCVANQGAKYDRFDAIVLMSAQMDVLLQRVAHRANPFGSTPADRTKIVADKDAYEPLLRAGASQEIDTRLPPANVVLELAGVFAGLQQVDHMGFLPGIQFGLLTPQPALRLGDLHPLAVRSLMRSASNSATIASTSNNRRPTGSMGS